MKQYDKTPSNSRCDPNQFCRVLRNPYDSYLTQKGKVITPSLIEVVIEVARQLNVDTLCFMNTKQNEKVAVDPYHTCDAAACFVFNEEHGGTRQAEMKYYETWNTKFKCELRTIGIPGFYDLVLLYDSINSILTLLHNNYEIYNGKFLFSTWKVRQRAEQFKPGYKCSYTKFLSQDDNVSCVDYYYGAPDGNCNTLKRILFANTRFNKNIDRLTGMFYGCKNLEVVSFCGDTGRIGESVIKTTKYMFYGCKNLRLVDLRPMNFSKIEDMRDMFNGCKELKTINIDRHSNLDFKNLKTTDRMFKGCKNLSTQIFSESEIKGIKSKRDMYKK